MLHAFYDCEQYQLLLSECEERGKFAMGQHDEMGGDEEVIDIDVLPVSLLQAK